MPRWFSNKSLQMIDEWFGHRSRKRDAFLAPLKKEICPIPGSAVHSRPTFFPGPGRGPSPVGSPANHPEFHASAGRALGEPRTGAPAFRREGICRPASCEHFGWSDKDGGPAHAQKGARRQRKALGRAGGAIARPAEPSRVVPSDKL